jgi:chorismate-pyruvate lyase
MNVPLRIVTPDLPDLFAPFPPADDQPDFELLPPQAVPAPYHGLLVHEHHMTVTVEAYHGDRVDVRILARMQEGSYYSRKILLALEKTGKIVQFGIVRANLDFVSKEVRDRIIEGKTPFGRILIEHNVLRRIEPTAFLRAKCGPAQMRWFGLKQPAPLYGRLAIIHCDGHPAVELLEIVAPEVK